MRTPVALLREHRVLSWRLAVRGVHGRYKGSMIGLVWTIITPLCMLAIYTFIFSVVFQARWGHGLGESKAAFAIVLVCGLTVYQIFSDSVGMAVQVIVGNPNYVKKVVFPLEVLPWAAHLTCLMLNMAWFLIAVVGVMVFLHRLCITTLALPLILIPLSMFTMGICWLVASLGVFLRDLNHFINIMLRMLLFLTPIFYEMDRIPYPIRYVLYANPLAAFTEQARRVLVYNQWPDWTVLAILTLISAFVCQMGYLWFMRTKKGFADVL